MNHNDLSEVISSFSEKPIAHRIVLTRTFLRRWQDDDSLDRARRLYVILELATDVLGNSDKAARWSLQFREALGLTPLEASQTSEKTEATIEILHQIEHGVYS